jgi:hypothetical protein
MAGAGNHLSLAVAGRAGGHLHHRAKESLAYLADFTPPPASRTAARRGAGFGSRATTGTARFVTGDFDLFFDAEDCFLEAELDGISQVGPTVWGIARALARAASHAKAK